MAYGFLLIYLRDFAPGKEEWINSYSIGKHFETRLSPCTRQSFRLLEYFDRLLYYYILKTNLNTQRLFRGLA
jgi:hypothetical protein